MYCDALEQLCFLHTRGPAALHSSPLVLQKEFTTALYRWEQDYFFENCLGLYFGVERAAIEGRCQLDALGEIARRLGRQPRALAHRDFQSQNVIIRGGQAYLIDFQGLRPGLRQYDLASIVYDPYVALSAEERGELVNYYKECCARDGVGLLENFDSIFDLCAMQRLMQALGAYGYLGIVKQRAEFLKHIPPALANLREVVGRIGALKSLGEFLDGIRFPISAC